MANEKKKQTSTNKKKTSKMNDKQVKSKNQQTKQGTQVEKNMVMKKHSEMEKNVNTQSASNKISEKKQKTEKLKDLTMIEKKNKNGKEKQKNNELHTSKAISDAEKNIKKKGKVQIANHKIKNKNEKVVSSPIIDSDELGKFIKIIMTLIVIVVVFYGLTILVTKFQKNKVPDRNKITTPAVIQYDEILIGTMLNQAYDEYFVLIQKDDDMYQTLTSYYLQRYAASSNALNVYTANMNSVYNQFYVSETSNVRTNNIIEFRVSTITLLKIKNHEIIEAHEGIEEIEKAFQSLLN